MATQLFSLLHSASITSRYVAANLQDAAAELLDDALQRNEALGICNVRVSTLCDIERVLYPNGGNVLCEDAVDDLLQQYRRCFNGTIIDPYQWPHRLTVDS